jgi:uncharacterized membrane protein YgcG
MKQKGTAEKIIPETDKSEGDSQFRIALVKAVTTWALAAIPAIAALIILGAGINAIRKPDKDQMNQILRRREVCSRRASGGDRSLGRNRSRFLFRTGGFKKRCQSRASAHTA